MIEIDMLEIYSREMKMKRIGENLIQQRAQVTIYIFY